MSCLHQVLVFDVYYTLQVLTVGLSFVNVLVISFDRHYALARPLEYITRATKTVSFDEVSWIPYHIRSVSIARSERNRHKTVAVKVAIFANIIWLLLTIVLQFTLPPLPGFIFVTSFGVLFLIVPPVNYVRALLAIRHHNVQLGDEVTLQMSIILQREKRVALDMCIVAGLLFASLSPALSMSTVQNRYPRLHSILLPWSLTMSFIPSAVNPLIYFVRNKMRNAFKSIINM
ncbi:unnamed protein product [Porites evermanni]|uniref:G-protein coupled receptors family 1 profile domain-containing protein n=1 Tax=Porites evermanni TaxID=104178 RepID=A0ABN8SLD3_9CNID|nr:unnamed protein product [Porites evermanni]